MRLSAIAAHSTCQPGRPGPNGDGQLGSPGRSASHSSASSWSLLPARSGSPPRSANRRQHGVAVVAGLVAELRGGVGAEVHVGVLRIVDDVGGAGGEQLLDDLDDLGHRLGGGHIVTRRQHPQGRHVLAEQVGLPVGELAPADAVTLRTLEQRIVDVGDVLHVVHTVTGVQPEAVHQVEGQVGRGMTQMGGVIRGDPADVHGGGGARGHRSHLPVCAVVEPQLRPRPGSTGTLGADHDCIASTLNIAG